MLGSNGNAEHLGELKNLYKGQGEARCYVCDGLDCCSLFHGVDKLPKHNLYDEIFSRLDSDIEVLIDASKKEKWFKDFVDDKRYDIRLIHLVRDPRALARRWLMRFQEKKIGLRERIKQCKRYPHKFILIAFGDLLTVCIYKWVYQNKNIAEFIKRSGLPSKVISYREIAMEPDSILKDICDWVGLEYQPEQKNYWEFEQHGTQKYGYEWVQQQGAEKYLDQRWKEYLTQKQVKRIESNHLIKRLLSRLLLRFTPEGLESLKGAKDHNG
jgi:hypothetical protein